MSKHAYLIMAHHRMDLLQSLVFALDHENNDLYIHIDKKCNEQTRIISNKSKVYFLERMDVRWAGYSQVECEYRLLKLALSSDEQYQYLHLLTGASFPIKSNQFIFNFFNENYGKQFIGFDNNLDYSSRAKYRFLFNELGKPKSRFDYGLLSIRNHYIQLQKKLRINRFAKFNMQFKKGLAYWSITESCAKYILEKEKIVKKMLRYSVSGDEVFVQTLVYNSPFKDSIYDLTNEYEGCLVAAAWKKFVGEDRIGHNFLLKDFNILEESDLLYALKFEGQEGVDLIHQIENKLL